MATLSVLALTAVPLASADGNATPSNAAAMGLKAEYFNEMDLTALVTERVDPTVNFEWDEDTEVPAPGVDPHTFSVRWTGTVTPRFSERYTISTRSDDGVRVFVDGELIIDNWTKHAVTENSHQVDLTAGRAHGIRVEFYENLGRAEMRLRWRSESQDREVIPASQLAPPAAPAPEPVTPEPAPVTPEEPAADTSEEPAPVTPEEPAADTSEEPAPVTPAPAPAALPVPTISTPAPPVLPAAPVALASEDLPPPSTPVAGESFNAEPVEGGEVFIRMGEKVLVLDRPAALPVGTRLDARTGAVRIETAPAKRVKRPVQFANISGATFKVTQAAKGDRVVGLAMTHGDFESCTSTSTRSGGRGKARSAARSNRTVRRLFGSGKGRFRTRGRHAAATVRGTVWSVEDRCDSSIVRVVEGLVDAENLLTGKVVPVGAGESYTVRRAR